MGSVSVFALNSKWRIGYLNDPSQWTLEKVTKSGQWKPVSFCRTKFGLLLSVKEKVTHVKDYTGNVNSVNMPITSAAEAALAALPDRVEQWAS